MLLRKLLKNRGLGMNLLAGFCLLAVLAYGWGLDLAELGIYLLAILIVLLGLMALAALAGWLIYLWKKRGERKRTDEPWSGQDDKEPPKS